MNDFLHYQRRVFLLILGIALAGAIGVYAAFPGRGGLALGLLIGSLCGLVRFRLQVNAILRLSRDPENARAADSVKTSFFGFLIMAGGLYLVSSTQLISDGRVGGKMLYMDLPVWLAFAGLLLPQAVLWLDGFLRPSHLAPMQAPQAGMTQQGDSREA